MARSYSIYICQQCGYRSPSFLGKCPECNSWNSFVETAESEGKQIKHRTLEKAEIIDIKDIKKIDYVRVSTKLEEFDRVLGGGIVPGSLILVSGDAGIGKSTLLTELALNIKNSLYIAGEESARQIKLRSDRISPNASLAVLNSTDADSILASIMNTNPPLVIVDSIQTLETSDLEGIAGSYGQVRECAHRLQKIAKELHIPIFLIGHVTKEGNLAGPKTLEHIVDVVLSLEGDPISLFRILRAGKNRFGPTNEVGIFEMEGEGLKEVKNPSKVFLDQKVNAPGSAVVATSSGRRPILVEIQALVVKSFLPVPRRTASGVDHNRLQLMTAVLAKRLNLPLFDKDIFINVTGGLRLDEPAIDLGICMAIISSLKDLTIKPKSVFLGEIGLLGELREIPQMEARIKEAHKLGFKNIVSFKNAKNLNQAIKLAFYH